VPSRPLRRPDGQDSAGRRKYQQCSSSIVAEPSYTQVKDRKGGKRAALSGARKIVRQACHLLGEIYSSGQRWFRIPLDISV
jgi:hypothetical protein